MKRSISEEWRYSVNSEELQEHERWKNTTQNSQKSPFGGITSKIIVGTTWLLILNSVLPIIKWIVGYGGYGGRAGPIVPLITLYLPLHFHLLKKRTAVTYMRYEVWQYTLWWRQNLWMGMGRHWIFDIQRNKEKLIWKHTTGCVWY